MIGVNKPQTIVGTSLVGVCAEHIIGLVVGNDFDPIHIAADTGTHLLLNTLHIHLHSLEKHIGKKGARYIEASVDAFLHMIGKYGAHHLIHHFEHHQKHAEKVALWGMQHLHALHVQSDTCSPSILTVPILVCLISEQIYKNFFDKKFHS